jgi:hypothetical protein
MATRKTRANAEESAAPPSRVRCKLNTVDDVKAEMARLYREGKAGTRSVGDVSRLANVLSLMGRLIEGADFEARLATLEAAKPAGGDKPWSQRH